MRTTFLILLGALLLCTGSANGQKKIPLLQSNSYDVSYHDGKEFFRNGLNLKSTKDTLDVTLGYHRKETIFTFTSGIDSIKVKFIPNAKVFFKVVVNKKDTILVKLNTEDWL